MQITIDFQFDKKMSQKEHYMVVDKIAATIAKELETKDICDGDNRTKYFLVFADAGYMKSYDVKSKSLHTLL